MTKKKERERERERESDPNLALRFIHSRKNNHTQTLFPAALRQQKQAKGKEGRSSTAGL
jgi:hypothetical protein